MIQTRWLAYVESKDLKDVGEERLENLFKELHKSGPFRHVILEKTVELFKDVPTVNAEDFEPAKDVSY